MSYKLLFLVVLSGLIAGCNSGGADPMVTEDDVVLVEVDGRPVTLPMLEFLMETRGVTEQDTEQMRELLDELIRLRAMANRAEAEGISDRAKVRAERMIKDIEVQYVRYLEHFQAESPISEADIQQMYQQQRQRSGDRQFRIEAIHFDSQADALTALTAVQDGQSDFDQQLALAEQAGREVSRPGWIDRSQVPDDVALALDDSDQGEILSTLMPYQDQWLIARVLETQPLQIPPLEQVREGIRRTLAREQNQFLIDETFESATIVPMLPLEDDEAAEDSDAAGAGGGT